MRHALLSGLVVFTPLLAQEELKSAPSAGHWNMGIIRQSPDFTGSYEKTDGGDVTRFDTAKDLGLGKDTTGIGLLADYEGKRFRIHLASYSQNFSGDQVLTRNTDIGGKTFQANGRLKSQIKLKNFELDWTIKAWRWEEAYIGVDLGFNVWNLDINGEGNAVVVGSPTPIHESAHESGTIPIPQIGLSAGGHFGDQVDVRAYYHLLQRSGASYHRLGAEVRYWPLKWLGLRANLENEGFDVPEGSIDDDLQLKIDKNGMGFGVIFRF